MLLRLYAAKKAKRIPSKVWGNFKLTHKHSNAYEHYFKYTDKPHFLRKHLYNAENPHSDEPCSLFKDNEEINMVRETVKTGQIYLIPNSSRTYQFEATKQFESVIGTTITNEEAQSNFVVFKYSQTFELPDFFRINDVHIGTTFPI
ncbi:hypothetical protein ACF0H5_001520 [Mactra antiquata]